jgi:4-hydroxyphenylacetate 3-monooxygenase
LWDAIGSEFGARHTLYERNYGGSPELVRLNVVDFAEQRDSLGEMIELVETCMGDYDLDGWTRGPWQ